MAETAIKDGKKVYYDEEAKGWREAEDDMMENCVDCDNCKEEEPETSNLGEGVTFADVEHLREQLLQLELDEYNLEEKILSLTDEANRAKAEGNWEIDKLITKNKNDKEARKDAGYTNNTDWEKALKNEILVDDILEIQEKQRPILEKVEKAKHELKIIQLDIKNLKRKFSNRQIYAPLLHSTVTVKRINMDGRQY